MNMDPKLEGLELSEEERKEYQLVGQINWVSSIGATLHLILPYLPAPFSLSRWTVQIRENLRSSML